MVDRYTASGNEAEWQPGSNKQVLRNKEGITSPGDMEQLELHLLEELYEHIFDSELEPVQLSVAHLNSWHYQWLGNVYDWAGAERNVNVSKGGFLFAVAPLISRLLAEFESAYLQRYTPCSDLDRPQLVEAIAVTHVELILIHPFREGNGRLARLLADVMAVQAGFSLLDYAYWDSKKSHYIDAIHQGQANNYEPMMALVDKALSN